MANGHAESFRIHTLHHLPELRAVRRAMLSNVKLPLMDHFMRQNSPQFFFRLVAK
jgi:hypothetical protein